MFHDEIRQRYQANFKLFLICWQKQQNFTIYLTSTKMVS